MKSIYEISAKSVAQISTDHIRSQIRLLEQKERLICLKGSRGTGKTTLLLQYAKTRLHSEEFLYISLDNIFFSNNKLFDFADDFVKNGGKQLLIDEIHYYPEWSVELKNIYDIFPKLKVIYTGSSLIHLKQGRADLSRRSVTHTLPGLSLREYIEFSENVNFQPVTLSELLENHVEISKKIWQKIKPIKKYREYIESGYFPFFLEGRENYQNKVREIINQIIESDLSFVADINYHNSFKLRQLLYVISESAPFKPNIEKLSERISISKNTLKDYLHHMNDVQLIKLLYRDSRGISRLTKPEKIFLHNPNLMYAIAEHNTNPGNIRETFFLNQLSAGHLVNYTEDGDFMVDNKYTFEIGGKNKKHKQIAGLKNSYLAMDDIETGYKNEIPLWLFGFLY